uniref:Uncharacterized protein n=1 Tax=Rhipicephalus appendiculatus TaxID=34631 RepID=A0A131YD83_RHIAP
MLRTPFTSCVLLLCPNDVLFFWTIVTLLLPSACLMPLGNLPKVLAPPTRLLLSPTPPQHSKHNEEKKFRFHELSCQMSFVFLPPL